MKQIMKSWFKYFLFAGIFKFSVNLIYLSVPIYMMIVFDRVLFSFSTATLYALSAGVFLSLVVMVLLDYISGRMLIQAGNRMVRAVEPFVLRSMVGDAAAPNGAGYRRGCDDLERLRSGVARGDLFYLFDLSWLLFYLVVLYIIHPLVGIVGITGVLMTLLFQLLLGFIEKKRYAGSDVAFQANASFLSYCLDAAHTVTGLKMLPDITALYGKKQDAVTVLRTSADVLYVAVGSVIHLLYLAVPVAVFGTGAFAFFHDEVTAGTIFACVLVVSRLFLALGEQFRDMPGAIATAGAFKRLSRWVDVQPSSTRLELPPPEGGFSAQGVSLALAGRKVLHNISFELQPGEMLGVFGPSSAGKTSLCRVLLGIWPPITGKIRLDGAELHQWPEEVLGIHVGYMPQEPDLLPVSVARNIARLGEPDPEKVVKAAEKAGVHEMILAFPRGYDTRLEPGGKNLAAGLRQSLSLARALYGDPVLVVLDEPHTFMDEQGMQRLFMCLEKLKREKTTAVVVSDRPKILTGMDKLLMLKEGQAAMHGPTREVMAQLSGKQQPRKAVGV